MKKILLHLFIIFTYNHAIAQTSTDSVLIFDQNFEKALVEQKIDKDGKVNGRMNIADAKGVTELVLWARGITNLKGIEVFTDLRELDCPLNQITSLDISKNLNLENISLSLTKLTNLDISKNTILKHFSCGGKLTNLDVSKNINLESLNCFDNQLTNIDISKNIKLIRFDCSHNQLDSINVSTNVNLKDFQCYENHLTSLDISNNTNLTKLDCSKNELTNLDISGIVFLNYLKCSFNKLNILNTSKNKTLYTLDCSNNLLTNLDISKNGVLKEFSCSSNQFTNLDVSNNILLKWFVCSKNKLADLDIRKHMYIDNLDCRDNFSLRTIYVNNVFEAVSKEKWIKSKDATYKSHTVKLSSKSALEDILVHFIEDDKDRLIHFLSNISKNYFIKSDTSTAKFSKLGITLKKEKDSTKFNSITIRPSSHLYIDSLLLNDKMQLKDNSFPLSIIKTFTLVNESKRTYLDFEIKNAHYLIKFRLRSVQKLLNSDIIQKTIITNPEKIAKKWQWTFEQITVDENKILEHKKTAALPQKQPLVPTDVPTELFLFLLSGKYEQALPLVDGVLEKYPNDLEMTRTKISVLTNLKQYSEAQKLSVHLIKNLKSNDNSDILNYQELLLIAEQYKDVIEVKRKYYSTFGKSTDRMLLILYANFAKHILTNNNKKEDEAIAEAIPYLSFKDYNWSFDPLGNWLINSNNISLEDKLYIANTGRLIQIQK